MTDLNKIYNYIINDYEIIDIYSEIQKEEDKDKLHGWAYHNYNHVLNVSKTIETILKELRYDDDVIIKAKIAGILHDVGALHGKDNHAVKSYEYAINYFNKNNINFKDKEQVLEAIKIHNNGFETNNIIALTLIFADKIDIKKTRVTENGKNINGMRQLLYINDIKFEIENNILTINFYVDKNLDVNELNNFYFTHKVFKAVESFSNKLNLSYKILMNDDLWILDKN